jgi:SPP1 family predicted phage head-tail adaptor
MLTKDKRKHIGDFRQSITFEYVTVTSGATGGNETWSTLTTGWANIKPINGFQRLQMQAQNVIVSHIAQVRYRGDLDLIGYANQEYDNLLRIKYTDKNERIFNVQYVINEDEYGAYFEIAVKENK